MVLVRILMSKSGFKDNTNTMRPSHEQQVVRNVKKTDTDTNNIATIAILIFASAP
jgi:hypothetical protein